MHKRAPKNIVAIVPVWGADYTKTCTDLMLPSLLATGNLGEAKPDVEISLIFACPPETQAAIQESPAGQTLAQRVDIVFVDNTDLIGANGGKYRAMTKSIHRVLNGPMVTPGETAVLFLNPDVVVGGGLIREVWNRLSDGKRAVMVSGLRTRLDSLPETLGPHWQGGVLEIPAAHLSRLAIKHLHPASTANVWNHGEHPLHWPSMVWYRAEDGSLLMHCFHLHPIALICPDPLPQSMDTVDGDFLQECRLTPETLHIARDGDALVLVEVSGEPYSYPEPLTTPSKVRVANFGVRHMSDIHWHLFGQRIVYAAGDVVPACGELDNIVGHVMHNRYRRGIARHLPRLDKHLLAPLFHLSGRLRKRA